ncbi:MAG: YARHG domain-containing protein [Oribacterium parvum]|uniref:YARHG domain-containing protein n=1 Tax=Oribacterium parvum TaxID=1501329 RepID=A0A930DQF4_9FIRM|nr:YARHG domain-containing protein [Oribacterium parvum]
MTEQFKENKSMENASREEEHIFPEALSSKAEPSNTEAKPGQLLPGLVIFALAVIVGGGYLLLRPKNHGIDLNSYLKIQSIGSDGQGTLEAEIDWDALLEKEKENIRYSKESEEGFLPLLYPDAVDYAKNIIMLPDFSQTTDLKNGDTVQYHWDFSEESAKNLAIPLSLKGGSYKISGLTKEDSKKTSDATDPNKENASEQASLAENEKESTMEQFTVSTETQADANAQSVADVQPGAGGGNAAVQTPATGEYLYAESASRLLSTADVSNFQARYPNSMFPGERSITQMIINEMYARHGYIFKDQALTDYFAQKSWYTPRTADMEEIYPVMNDVEQANVTLLRTYS